MQSLSDDERKEVLGSVLMDELKVIREYLADIPQIKKTVSKLEKNDEEHTIDLKVIKAAVKDQSRQLRNHERRIGTLEASQ